MKFHWNSFDESDSTDFSDQVCSHCRPAMKFEKAIFAFASPLVAEIELTPPDRQPFSSVTVSQLIQKRPGQNRPLSFFFVLPPMDQYRPTDGNAMCTRHTCPLNWKGKYTATALWQAANCERYITCLRSPTDLSRWFALESNMLCMLRQTRENSIWIWF